ncbi:MAG: hypothetical protein ACUVUQ_11020 [Thermodesulfovibrionales bacterium]
MSSNKAKTLKDVLEILTDPDEEVQEKLKKELHQTKEQAQKFRETLQTKEASLEEELRKLK